jgi:hypothetical protein
MNSDPKLIKDSQELSHLICKTEDSGSIPCTCSLLRCEGWDTMSDSMWPQDQLIQLGTLRDSCVDEPTFEEFQPTSLRADDPKALISIEHFPYNRCDVFACTKCNQAVMRYTEYGGYYIDHRARRVRAEQIIKGE